MRLIDADALKTDLTRFYDGIVTAKQLIDEQPTVEPKRGKWVERRVSYVPDSDIYEMQSAKCSACGLYHTTPYQYFFKDCKFCPHCGADMREGGETDGR